MAQNEEYQFKKLNDLLCNSFNNIKFDVRDINGKIENLKTNFASFSTDSVKTAFEAQTRIIQEQQQTMNQLSERLIELENRKPSVVKEIVREVSRPIAAPVVVERGMNLADLRKVAKVEKAVAKSKKASRYDIPEGEVRITKTQFKSNVKGKGNKKLNGEWIEVTGYGVDMKGYKLHDKGRKHTFEFPEGYTIYGPVKIFTGKGRNTNTRLYWGNPRPIWNDTGDVATLRMKNKIVSQVISEPTYSFKTLK